MLGFSVYLGGTFDKSYIKTMLEKGFKYIFTSLQIPEEDSRVYLHKLMELKQLTMGEAEIIADVNSNTLESLGLSYQDSKKLKELGIDWIRLDETIELSNTLHLLENLKLVCNASTNSIQFLDELSSSFIDFTKVMVAHNYYPRPETGLSEDYFNATNQKIKEKFPNIKIMAFVQGDDLRGPVFKGLPTLESHRNVHPLVAARQLNDALVDIVCVGDSSINHHHIRQFYDYYCNQVLSLKVHLERELPYPIYDFIFHNRLDVARDVIRAEESRRQFTFDLEPYNTVKRPLGSITIDNKLYGRYMNELQITKVNLPSDKAVNVVGHIDEEDLPCLELIDSGKAFQLIKEDEDGY